MYQLSLSIVNLKRRHAYDVRIDRRTPYGNPFEMRDRSKQERDRVLREFEDWIWKIEQQALRQAFVDLINSLAKQGMESIRLACWCAPERCHGNIWIEVYQRMIDEAVADHVSNPND